jgi:hypothetical protein
MLCGLMKLREQETQILYRRSTDGGASFGPTVNLSNTTENSVSPHVAASNNLSL